MKNSIFAVLLALLATLALAVMLAAQEPASTGQSSGASEAQNPAQSSDPSTPSQGGEMPETASPLPLLALLGITSLGAGATIHHLSRRRSV